RRDSRDRPPLALDPRNLFRRLYAAALLSQPGQAPHQGSEAALLGQRAALLSARYSRPRTASHAPASRRRLRIVGRERSAEGADRSRRAAPAALFQRPKGPRGGPARRAGPART